MQNFGGGGANRVHYGQLENSELRDKLCRSPQALLHKAAELDPWIGCHGYFLPIASLAVWHKLRL